MPHWATQVMTVVGGLAAFSVAVGILWRTAPVRWLRKKLNEDRVAELHASVADALTEVLSNGNPISEKIDGVHGSLKALADKVGHHIDEDRAAFSSIADQLVERSKIAEGAFADGARRLENIDKTLDQSTSAAKVLAANVETVKWLAAEDRARQVRIEDMLTARSPLIDRIHETTAALAADLVASHERAEAASPDADAGAAADASAVRPPEGEPGADAAMRTEPEETPGESGVEAV